MEKFAKDSGRWRIAKNFTLEDFIARSGAGSSSLDTYRYNLGQVEGWIGKPLAQASLRDIEKLKAKLRGMASGKHYVTLARMFYRAAGRYDILEVLKIRQRLHKLREDEILVPSEVQAMVDALAGGRDKAFVATLWDTGVRVHELLAVDLADMKGSESPENGGRKVYAIWFKKTKIPGEEHHGFVIEAAPVLELYLKAHPDPRPEAPLFVAWNGKRLGYSGALEIVKKAARRAGIRKRVYNHLFRHSRATHLLRLGLKEIEVKRLLGWAPSSTMLQRYAHLGDKDDYAAALRAQGLKPPETVDLGRLEFGEDRLKPVVPLVPPLGRIAVGPDALPPGTAEGDVDGMVQDMLKECGLTVSELMAVFRVGMTVLARAKGASP